MGLTLKEIPINERPREKLQKYGPEALTDVELLAILINTGYKEYSAIDVAREIIKAKNQVINDDSVLEKQESYEFGNLTKIKDYHEITNCKGIGPAKAITIMAALEIGRRVSYATAKERFRVNSPKSCADLLMPYLRYKTNEHFVAVLLDSKNKVIQVAKISEGSLNSSIVHPREVFKPAILNAAASILVGHNHPSGDPKPSREDKNITKKLVAAGEDLCIPVLDHIIIGDGKFFSFKEQGYI